MKRFFRSVVFSVLVFVFLVFVPLVSFGVPAMWGVAVNETTKECGGYWGGDENTWYTLPTGWTAYYPVEESGKNFITVGDKKIEFNWKYQDFCNEIGYRYTGDNVGNLPSAGTEKNLILYISGGVILVGGVFFAMKIFKKKRV